VKRQFQPVPQAIRALALVTVLGLALTTSCKMFGYKPTPLELDSGKLYSDIMAYAGTEASKAFGRLNGGFPTYAVGDRWQDSEDFGWARGLYPGMVWLLYQSSDDTTYFKLARTWTEGLEKFTGDASGFGLGLVFYPSYVTGYQITGNRTYREGALRAAEMLASRFTPAGFFPAFGEPGDTVLGRRLSIESMMDVELLYWASEATGNKQYARMASQHAFFTLQTLVGSDGRILHMADFDPNTGRIQGEKTPQLAENDKYNPKGYSPSSVWSLGQAWAIYGFTTAYRHDGNTLFLNAAERVADFFINNLPEDGIPLWDFELPEGAPRQKDSSAAAVAAAGLLKLALACPSQEEAQRYRNAAFRIIKGLNATYFGKAGGSGILAEGVYGKINDSGGEGATSWGDYFYIEALLLLQDRKG